MSDDLLEEVRDDVRREELLAFWQKYWQWIISSLVVVMLSTIGYIIWTNHQLKYRDAQTSHYEKALNYLHNNQNDLASAELDVLSKKDDPTYTTVSLLTQAGITTNGNDVLQKIIDDNKIDESFRQLASLILSQRYINADDPGAAMKILTTLVNTNSPWRASAQELLAVTLYHTGAIQKAANAFQMLAADQAASQDIRLRAKAFVEFIREN